MIYFLGIVVSLLVQYIKSLPGFGGIKTLGLLLAISLVASGIYTGLQYTGLWDSVAQILITAGAFYAFILQRFETTKKKK